jgi:hypothetical protein
LVVTIGYSFGRKVLLWKDQVLGNQGFWPTFSEVLKLIVGFLSHHQPLLASAACLAIGEMGRSGPLTQSGGEPDELRDKVVAELLRLMKSEKVSMKVRERAALSCGLICVGDVAFPDRQKIIQNFLDSAQVIYLHNIMANRPKSYTFLHCKYLQSLMVNWSNFLV